MSGKHLCGQLWINVHLFFKLEIKPDLPPKRFYFCSVLFQRKKKRGGLNETDGETKKRRQSNRVIVSPTDGELARRSQTVKVERTKGEKKKKGLDKTGGRGNRQMLLISVVGS